MALIVKKCNVVYIFDTIGSSGVKLRKWSEFYKLNWHLLYEKIAYRELTLNHPDSNYTEIEEKIMDFVEKTKNKPYILSCSKLCCFSAPKQYEIRNEWEKSKGFFCSQLVAASYKNAGIIGTTKKVGLLLPGMFSSKHNPEKVYLNSGFNLGVEYNIDFT